MKAIIIACLSIFTLALITFQSNAEAGEKNLGRLHYIGKDKVNGYTISMFVDKKTGCEFGLMATTYSRDVVKLYCPQETNE